MGAVDILIVWENLDIQRIGLKNHQTDGKMLWMTPLLSLTYTEVSILFQPLCQLC